MSSQNHPTEPGSSMANLEIISAVRADISALAELHVAAFRRDLAVSLMFHNETQHYDEVVGMVRKQIAGPQALVIKACDPTSRETIGFAIWLLFDGTEENTSSDDTMPAGEKGERSIADAISGEARKMRAHWMMGKKYMH